MQQFESFTKMIMATTTDPVAIQVGNGARIRISDERGNNLFIQKYMLLNTDKASTDFLLLNVLDLKWTVMGPNDQGLNDNKLDGQLQRLQILTILNIKRIPCFCFDTNDHPVSLSTFVSVYFQ